MGVSIVRLPIYLISFYVAYGMHLFCGFDVRPSTLVWQDETQHIHIWHGTHHHHFRQKLGIDLCDDEETQHKTNFETASHPPGTVVAPMAGLVVKVLVKDESKVEEGQPILVLEAMKMEVCCDASNILDNLFSLLISNTFSCN